MLKELEKKQECEREFLEKLLQEEQTSELRKKAQKQSQETRTERLTELKVRFFIHSEAHSRIEPGEHEYMEMCALPRIIEFTKPVKPVGNCGECHNRIEKSVEETITPPPLPPPPTQFPRKETEWSMHAPSQASLTKLPNEFILFTPFLFRVFVNNGVMRAPMVQRILWLNMTSS